MNRFPLVALNGLIIKVIIETTTPINVEIKSRAFRLAFK